MRMVRIGQCWIRITVSPRWCWRRSRRRSIRKMRTRMPSGKSNRIIKTRIGIIILMRVSFRSWTWRRIELGPGCSPANWSLWISMPMVAMPSVIDRIQRCHRNESTLRWRVLLEMACWKINRISIITLKKNTGPCSCSHRLLGNNWEIIQICSQTQKCRTKAWFCPKSKYKNQKNKKSWQEQLKWSKTRKSLNSSNRPSMRLTPTNNKKPWVSNKSPTNRQNSKIIYLNRKMDSLLRFWNGKNYSQRGRRPTEAMVSRQGQGPWRAPTAARRCFIMVNVKELTKN